MIQIDRLDKETGTLKKEGKAWVGTGPGRAVLSAIRSGLITHNGKPVRESDDLEAILPAVLQSPYLMATLVEGETQKHLAGGKHSHDQRTHGFRYSGVSLSRVRRMQNAGTFDEFKKRARARKTGTGTSPEPDNRPAHARGRGPEIRKLLTEEDRRAAAAGYEATLRVEKLEYEVARARAVVNDLRREYDRATTNEEHFRIEDEITAMSEHRDKLRGELAEAKATVTGSSEADQKIRDALTLPEDQRTTHPELDIGANTQDVYGEMAFMKEGVPEGLGFIQSIAGPGFAPTSPPRVVVTTTRAHYDPEKHEIALAGFSERTDHAPTVIHEYGHAIESTNPKILAATKAYRDSRTTDAEYQHMGYGFGDREFTKPDKFLHRYFGKLYPQESMATEILSMGLEWLYSNPARLAALDPDLFDFLIWVVQGGLTGKEFTEKHLAGGKHSHDQRTHGFRYGSISVSRARRMKQAGTFDDYKKRARARQDGGTSPRPTPRPDRTSQYARTGKEARERMEAIQARVKAATDEADNARKALSDTATTWHAMKDRAGQLHGEERERAYAESDKFYEDHLAGKFDASAEANKREYEVQKAALAETRAVLEVPPDRRGTIEQHRAPSLTEQQNRDIDFGVERVEAMVDRDVLRKDRVGFYQTDENRPYYQNNNRGVYLNTHHRADSVVHELGHWLENQPEIMKRSIEFLERRTKGSRKEHMGEGYRHDEYTRPDKFLHRYMGKIYQLKTFGIYSTEILSMGLEMFFEDPLKLARMDPEYFDFIFGIVRGEFTLGKGEALPVLERLDALKQLLTGYLEEQMGETEKHLAGAERSHNQKSHGRRYGPNVSLSRLRRMRNQSVVEWQKYKTRIRTNQRLKTEGHEWRGRAHFDATLRSSTAGEAGGVTIRMNRKIWDEMTPGSRRALIAHELAHQTIDKWRERTTGEWDRAERALYTGDTRSGMKGFLDYTTNLAEAIADFTAFYLGHPSLTFNTFLTPAQLSKATSWIEGAFRRAGYTVQGHQDIIEKLYKMLEVEASKGD